MSPAAVVPLEIRPGTSMTGVRALMDEPALLAGAGEEVRRQVDDAAAATVLALRRRGLVTGASGAALRLTEHGQVLRQQAEGLRIRVLHGVVSALGEQATGELRSTVQALGSVLTPEVPPASGARPALPG